MIDQPTPAYIFLDVDGVLNSLRTAVAFGGYKPEHLDRAAMHLVDHLCKSLANEGFDPRIVVSSTWRMKYPEASFWNGLFNSNGCYHTRFVGCTPIIRDSEPNRRGREVKAWVDGFQPGTPYVCLDDDNDFLLGQPLVLTSHIWGLGLDEIDEAFFILTGKRLFMSTLRTDSKWKAIRVIGRTNARDPTDS